jgi:hypothetical protein
MQVCDVCNKNIRWDEGFVLTTRQVTTSEVYWERTFKGPWSYVHGMDPSGASLAMLVQQQASQSSGWLVCESCSSDFSFDKVKAKADATGKNNNPPGAGPAPMEEVARVVSNVWKRLYGNQPSSIKFG